MKCGSSSPGERDDFVKCVSTYPFGRIDLVSRSHVSPGWRERLSGHVKCRLQILLELTPACDDSRSLTFLPTIVSARSSLFSIVIISVLHIPAHTVLWEIYI